MKSKRIFKIIAFLIIFMFCFSGIAFADTDTQKTTGNENSEVQDAIEEIQKTDSETNLTEGEELFSTYSQSITYPYYTAIASSSYTYTDKAGYSSFDKALSAMKSSDDENIVVLNSKGKVVAMKAGMAAFYKSAGGTITLGSTYISSKYCGYYNSTVNETKATVTISGYKGNAKLSELILIPKIFIENGKYQFDYYYVSSGKLWHKINRYDSSGTTFFSAVSIDNAPSFMKSGKKYYSCDGINFYNSPWDVTDSNKKPIGTFYPYFKYLSYRSQTSYSASRIDAFIKEEASSSSVLINQGKNFIKYQNLYGVNAILELSFANLESAWGTSWYAKNRNNLFGISAYDTNPDAAKTFSSVADCIRQHTKFYMNRGYLDAYAYTYESKLGTSYYDVSDRKKGYITGYAGDSRYFGSNTGNKAIGINVKYASDPFHGEKIAGLAYNADRAMGGKDYGKHTLGITKTGAYAYSKASTSSTKLYRYASKATRSSSSPSPIGMTVIILGESGNFYKIQSEMPVNKDGYAYCGWDYDFNTSVAYVKKSDIEIIYTSQTDKSTLEGYVNSIPDLDEDLYTKESFEKFKDAYIAAVDIITSDKKLLQSEIDEAYNTLKTAYEGLVKIEIENKITSIVIENSNPIEITDNLEPIHLSISISPSNASLTALKWSSSDESVAKVSQTGVITPIKNGSATITLKAKDGSDVSASIVINIVLPKITSDKYEINEKDNVIEITSSDIMCEDFLKDIIVPEGMNVKLVDSNEKEVTSGNVKTAMSIVLYSSDNNIMQKIDVCLRGDVNADGTIDIGDFVLIRSVLLGKTKLEKACKIAADVTKDGNVDIGDFVKIRAILLGK